jgi:hypothetical protein
MWNIRGWQRLTAHHSPQLAAAKHDFLWWLDEVPEHWRSTWKRRLQSRLEHPHLSVRLELYLHHHFKNSGWSVEIEPELFETPNRPDFRITRNADCLIVEGKVVLDEETIAQETERLRQLADNLGGKLSREIIIEPLSDLPSSLPTRRIKAQIEHWANTQVDEVVEFDLSDEHLGTQYMLKIIILPRYHNSTQLASVSGMKSGVHILTIGKRVRDALEQKAGKYGSINLPFIIAIHGAGQFPVKTSDELDALFGDRIWSVHSGSQVTERRRPNGFFTSEREGGYRHQHVSAVLFYRFKWLGDTHAHMAHIYHNPFASKPLNAELFPGVPQALLDDDGILKWINGRPE